MVAPGSITLGAMVRDFVQFCPRRIRQGFIISVYNLELDTAASSPMTNVWNLYLTREEQPNKLLMTLPLASEQHVSAADLENLLCSYFDQMIRANQPDGYIGKVMAQLRFGRTTLAAATCEDWIKARPDSWLARFTYAHVRCPLGQAQAAAALFRDWWNVTKPSATTFTWRFSITVKD